MMLQTNKINTALSHHKKTAKITQIAAILTLLLSTMAPSLFAQAYIEEYHVPVAGLVGGGTFTQVDGDGYKGYNKVGITGGGVIFMPLGQQELPIEGTIALSMEVLFTQKGSRGRTLIPNTNIVRQDINLQYAEVPIQLNFYRGPRKSGFGAGFAVGYLASSEETVDDGSGIIIKNALPFRKFDLNFVLTGNIHVWKGFFLSPRFQYSLLSVRNNNAQYGGRNEQFNNAVAIRLMYLFNRTSKY